MSVGVGALDDDAVDIAVIRALHSRTIARNRNGRFEQPGLGCLRAEILC